MKPALAILQLSDAFSDYLVDAVNACGMRPVSVSHLDQLIKDIPYAGCLMAAAGEESLSLSLIPSAAERFGNELVVIGSSSDYRMTANIMRAGARDYFALPKDVDLLHQWISGAAELLAGAEARAKIKAQARERFDFSKIIGRSAGIVEAIQRASKVIPQSRATVLLTGETGTGKELFAQAIHRNSARGDKPFVEINCSALPLNLLESELFGYERGAFTDARNSKVGLFELADGGTLFLDEIADLPIELQPKLLKVLETGKVRRLGGLKEHEVDFRIIAATHADLLTAVNEKRFRQDLYFRLNVIQLHLPPLREREDDVVLLADQFLDKFCEQNDIPRPELTSTAKEILRTNPWAGNIRELKNAVERAVLLGEGRLLTDELRTDGKLRIGARSVIPFPARLDEINRAAALETLKLYNGNKSRAAKALGISRKYLYFLLSPGAETIAP
jgi:two-component system, NtrC family, response regulator HydG